MAVALQAQGGGRNRPGLQLEPWSKQLKVKFQWGYQATLNEVA